jgi:hypothetical protein
MRYLLLAIALAAACEPLMKGTDTDYWQPDWDYAYVGPDAGPADAGPDAEP